jgi:hypothetical protein
VDFDCLERARADLANRSILHERDCILLRTHDVRRGRRLACDASTNPRLFGPREAVLAKYRGLIPHTIEHSDFIGDAMGA